MKIVRRFSLAPSLARLIRRERSGARITEGHFPDQSDRQSFVRLEGETCYLVLVSGSDGGVSAEERTEVSRAQGEILLDVCAGKATFERLRIEIGTGREAIIDRYVAPISTTFISVEFDDPNDAQAFRSPSWFGPELKNDVPADSRALALGARPKPWDGVLSNAALDALLDVLDHRGNRQAAGKPREDEMMTALQRLVRVPAANEAAPAPLAPVPVQVMDEEEALLEPEVKPVRPAAPAVRGRQG